MGTRALRRILVADCFCSDGVGVTLLVLCCIVQCIQYSTYPRRRDHHHRLRRVRSLSDSLLLPQEAIEDAACCEAEPWMHTIAYIRREGSTRITASFRPIAVIEL